MTGDDLAREVQARCDARVAEAVAAERQRVRRVLAGPLLRAFRSIPDGDIRDGCVLMDGRRVREQLRAAWLEVVNGGDSATGGSAVAEAAVHRITHAPPRSAVLAGPGHPKTMPQSESLDSPKGES